MQHTLQQNYIHWSAHESCQGEARPGAGPIPTSIKSFTNTQTANEKKDLDKLLLEWIPRFQICHPNSYIAPHCIPFTVFHHISNFGEILRTGSYVCGEVEVLFFFSFFLFFFFFLLLLFLLFFSFFSFLSFLSFCARFSLSSLTHCLRSVRTNPILISFPFLSVFSFPRQGQVTFFFFLFSFLFFFFPFRVDIGAKKKSIGNWNS